MSEDITFCLADCKNMKCERNKKNIKTMDNPHSFANFENIKGHCMKVEPKQSNYDRIKSMSVEEMADFITNLTNGCEYGCQYCANYVDGECTKEGYMSDYVKGCIQWLLQEVSEDE